MESRFSMAFMGGESLIQSLARLYSQFEVLMPLSSTHECTKSNASSIGLTRAFTSCVLRCWPYRSSDGLETENLSCVAMLCGIHTLI